MTRRTICAALFVLACMLIVPLIVEGTISGGVCFAWMLLACTWSLRLRFAQRRHRRGPHL